MANVASPFGLVQWGTVNGATPNFASMNNPPFRIAYNAGAIYYGDLVSLVSGSTPTGYITQWANGDGSATYQAAGVFFGCRYLSVSQRKVVWNNFWPGSDVASGQDVEAYVCADPNAIFMIQAYSGPINQSMVGMTCDVEVGSGNTTTGWSAMSLENPSTSNPSYLPFKIIGPVTAPPGVNGTDVTTAYNNVLVAFNNQIFKSLLTIHS